jgi:hypothetical protein
LGVAVIQEVRVEREGVVLVGADGDARTLVPEVGDEFVSGEAGRERRPLKSSERRRWKPAHVRGFPKYFEFV